MNGYSRIFLLPFISIVLLLIGCAHNKRTHPAPNSLSLNDQIALRVAQGQWLSQKGKTALAAQSFEQALTLAPEDIWLRWRLARELVQMGQWDSAVRHLEILIPRCFQDDPCISVFELAIQAYLEAQSKLQLEETLKLAIARFPSHLPFHLQLISFYLQEGNKEQALKQAQKLLELKELPKHEGYWYLAQVYAQLGVTQSPEYENYLKKALAEKADYLPAFLAYLTLLMERQQWDQALKEAEDWQTREGYSLPLSMLLLKIYAEKAMWADFEKQLTWIFQYEMDLKAAIGWISQLLVEKQQWDLLEKVLRISHDQGWLTDQQWNYLAGIIYKQKNDWVMAERFLLGVRPGQDFYLSAVQELVSLWMTQGQWEKASKWLEKVAQYPNAPESLFILALQVCEKQGDTHCARRWVERGLQRWPNSFTLLYWRLIIWDRDGKSQKALEEAQKMLTQWPKNPLLLNFIAYTWAQNGENLTQALELIDQALSLDSQNGHFLDTKGWILFRLGYLWEGLEYLKKALYYEPDEPVILEHIGDVYLALGQEESALLYYSLALEKNPHQSQLKILANKQKELKRQLEQGRFGEGSRRPALQPQ